MWYHCYSRSIMPQIPGMRPFMWEIASFSIPIKTKDQNQLTFIWKKYSFTVLPQGYIGSLRSFIWDLDILVILSTTMLIGQSNKEMASQLAYLVRYFHSREWEISPRKIQEPLSSVKFLRSWWPEDILWYRLSRVERKFLHPASSSKKKKKVWCFQKEIGLLIF